MMTLLLLALPASADLEIDTRVELSLDSEKGVITLTPPPEGQDAYIRLSRDLSEGFISVARLYCSGERLSAYSGFTSRLPARSGSTDIGQTLATGLVSAHVLFTHPWLLEGAPPGNLRERHVAASTLCTDESRRRLENYNAQALASGRTQGPYRFELKDPLFGSRYLEIRWDVPPR